MQKSPLIRLLLERLRDELKNGFVIADHWEADLFAIGIASPAEPRRLVFISTFGHETGYEYELEAPPALSDHSYDGIAEGHASSFEELVQIIRLHLELES